MNLIRRISVACWSFPLIACQVAALHAQQTLVTFQPQGPAAWNAPDNWDPANVPEAIYNEVALIGGGKSVFVADVPPAAGGAIMDSSTLEIRPGGNLTLTQGTDVFGNLVLGQSVDTQLVIRRGGSLTAASLVSGGGPGTTLTLGETSGVGVSALTLGTADLNRVTRIVGSQANFTTTGDLRFGPAQTLVPVLTSATHATIQVGGTAQLAGTLRPEFAGYAPQLGDAWDLVDANRVTGRFALDLSQTPTAPRGAGYYVQYGADAATLHYDNLLVLQVDRGTGAMQILNVLGDPIALDAYTIVSPSGVLTGAWNSLQDQGLPGWDEADNATATRLTEFKTFGAATLSAGATLQLGTAYAPPAPAAFGIQPGTDLSFQYHVPGVGTLGGQVELIGALNNLVLTINPATGEAAIQNESPYFDVAIDAYTLTSASGKLLTSNSSWNSLQDQGLDAWDEADNASPERLTEFQTSGFTFLPGGGRVLHLGRPVDISSEDLRLGDFAVQFHLSTGETTEGIVKFGELPVFERLAGDYNGDGAVDGGDLLAWQQSFLATVAPGSGADGNGDGVVNGQDLLIWEGAFPSVAGGASLAIPEPAGHALVLLTLAAAAYGRRARS
jgi:hypothetical protein